MADNQTPPKVVIKGATAWNPQSLEGRAATRDLIPKEGKFAVEAESITVEKGKEKEDKLTGGKREGNWQFVFHFKTVDADFPGYRLPKYQPYQGDNSSGPNITGLYKAMFIAGISAERINALQDGEEFEPADIVAMLVGKRFYVDVSATSFTPNGGPNKGQTIWNSQVDGWITKEQYEMAASVDAHRRALPPGAADFLAKKGGALSTGDQTAVAAAASQVVGQPANNGSPPPQKPAGAALRKLI